MTYDDRMKLRLTQEHSFQTNRIDLRKTLEIPPEPLQTPYEIEEGEIKPPSAPSPVRQSCQAVPETQPDWHVPEDGRAICIFLH